MRDKILETIYCDGNPNGIRIIQRKLSTIKAYVIPRDLLSAAKEITDINRPGIYYLINEADDNIIVQLYVGQTRNGISRLDDHHRKKDYWNKAIMFLSDSSTFSLDMISGLEKYAIKNACLSNRYKVENGVVPKFNIGKYEMSLVEEAYQEIQFIMSALGYKLDVVKKENNDNLFYIAKNGISASCIYSSEKIELLSGSQIDITKPVNVSKYNVQREELIKQGVLIENDGKYTLKMSLEFKSPSGASDFVLGGSTNGWVEWKNNQGMTLDQIYRKQTNEKEAL